jgi:glutamate-1-semialdehyde 2,1-aminomutase
MKSRYPDNYPDTLVKGKDGHIWDDNGNEYIDLISGLGSISVGYANDFIDHAAYMQIRKGTIFSLPNPIEYEVAQRLTELVPWTEQWRFGKTGTDGVLMAVRAARAYTGRNKILTSGYHGCTDHFECLGTRKAGMLDLTEYTKQYFGSLDYSDKSYAAIVLEPWLLEQQIYPIIRQWCDKTGTLLIADEVVTGGRFEGFTASSFIKVRPDIIVLGKGLANGFPLCAVGATRSIMSTFERDDFFASGTFGGECVSLAGAVATLDILQEELPQMIWNGGRIKEAFNKLNFKGKAVGYPTRLDFQFTNPVDKYVFWQEMCKNGVLVGYNNFIMATHTDRDVTMIIDAIFKSYKSMKRGVNLEGRMPEMAIRKTNG